MNRIARAVSAILLHLATLCGIALTLLVALSAVMRYVIGEPFAFTEELVGLLFSALVFLTLPYITLKRQHIEVTLLRDCFPAGVQRVCDVTARLLVVLFACWFGYYAWDFALMSYDLGSRSDIGGILLWPWMSLVVLACVLMGIFVLMPRGHGAANSDETPPLGGH